jgi:hypothetical protein
VSHDEKRWKLGDPMPATWWIAVSPQGWPLMAGSAKEAKDLREKHGYKVYAQDGVLT